MTNAASKKAQGEVDLNSVRDQARTGEVLGWLSAVHAFELMLADRYDWPWETWARLRAADATVVGALPDSVGEQSPLARHILSFAIEARRTGAEAYFPAEHFRNLGELWPEIDALPYCVALELMFIAFREKRWGFVNRLGRRLIARCPYAEGDPLEQRIKDLLFETIILALVRMTNAGFVDNPGVLLDHLEKIASARLVRPILERRSPTSLAFRAHRCVFQGDLAGAMQLYEEANAMTGFRAPSFAPTQTVIDIWKFYGPDSTDEAAQAAAWYAEQAQIEISTDCDTSNRDAILVSCEQVYFDHFAELFLQIVGLTNRGAVVHFHMINMDSTAALANLAAWSKKYGVQVSHTIENNSIMEQDPALKAGVCVNTRYIHLPAYLSRYRSVTVTDIDGWLEGPLAEIASFEGADAKISSWIWRRNQGHWRLPWANVAGGFLAVQATDAAKEFASLVSTYLQILYYRKRDDDRDLFYADQTAVFLSLRFLEEHRNLRVGFLRGGFGQSSEQRVHHRFATKRADMAKKIEALSQNGPAT